MPFAILIHLKINPKLLTYLKKIHVQYSFHFIYLHHSIQNNTNTNTKHIQSKSHKYHSLQGLKLMNVNWHLVAEKKNPGNLKKKLAQEIVSLNCVFQ